MKPISSALKTHIESDVTQLATCWKLTRRDGVVMGFTSHHKAIDYDAVSYKATSGFTPSAVKSDGSLSVDALEVEAVIQSGDIEERDIHAGLYDFAEVEIFMLNHGDIAQGALALRKGWLGEITYNQHHFTAEMRGLTQKLSQQIGVLYSPRCRAVFGDSHCGVNGLDYSVSSIVESVTNQRQFTDTSLNAENGFYHYGLVTFTSGNNQGLSMEVKRFQDGVIELTMAMPYEMQVSDAYDIVAGCDKRFATCGERFSNTVNFRGEPHVPGNDKLLSGN